MSPVSSPKKCLHSLPVFSQNKSYSQSHLTFEQSRPLKLGLNVTVSVWLPLGFSLSLGGEMENGPEGFSVHVTGSWQSFDATTA